MEPLFVKWRAFFHIEKEKKGFILFQRVRTFFLVMIGLVFFRSATVPDALRVLGRGVSGVGLQLFRNGVLSGLGLDWTELMILAVSILFSAWVTIHNQKEDMRVTLEKKPIWLALDRTVCAAVLCDFAGEIRTGLQRVRIYLSEFQGVI